MLCLKHIFGAWLPGLLLATLSFAIHAQGQQKSAIKWIDFNQLNDSLPNNKRPVFVYFYADWCKYCHLLENTTFADTAVIGILNRDYLAVKMNVETLDTIAFGGQVYTNQRANRPNPVHQIPLLLASRKNKPFSLPAMVFFTKDFVAQSRYFQYLGVKEMIKILRD